MIRRIALPLALAALGVLATTGQAEAATPLASLTAIVNPPPQNSLLSLCVTSHTLDPNGTCLTVGSHPLDAVGGTMTGVIDFGRSDDQAALDFLGFGGSPELRAAFTGFTQHPTPVNLEDTEFSPDPFPFYATDGIGACSTGQAVNGGPPSFGGINWPGVPVGLPFDTPVAEVVPMWGQLYCSGTFAGHSGPFTVNFAGTLTFSPPGPACCGYANLQGAWVVVFDS